MEELFKALGINGNHFIDSVSEIVNNCESKTPGMILSEIINNMDLGSRELQALAVFGIYRLNEIIKGE